MGLQQIVRGLDRLIGLTLSAGRWLVVPVVTLLFLQWPLRDLLRSHSREANDLGQWIFALYVAMCFTAATRAGTHLAADALARRYSERTRAWLERLGTLLGLVPWAAFVAIASSGMILLSLKGLEAFPDTYNPGYFIIKLALWLLAGLVLAQAIIDIARPRAGATDA